MKKTIVTVTGIRPDFIRMSALFKKLDEEFNHIMVHTGQHYDKLLSDVFFSELNIRKPDYNLEIGGEGKEHFHQSADASVKLVELLRTIPQVDCVIYLGDSNSVATAVAVKKEGYKIAHIEAGMRSYDNRMLEEINRKVCDTISDIHFVYHDNYKQNLIDEGHALDHIYVVGNTIVEAINSPAIQKIVCDHTQSKDICDHILIDIHRPENFMHKRRMENLFETIKALQSHLYKNTKFYMLDFKRTSDKLKEFGMYDLYSSACEIVPLKPFNEYIKTILTSRFLISDSGTAQEEPALLGVPVIVPRNFSERYESVYNDCSRMIDLDSFDVRNTVDAIDHFLSIEFKDMSTEWMGTGDTSQQIINTLKEIL